jgi:hypothetical protein
MAERIHTRRGFLDEVLRATPIALSVTMAPWTHLNSKYHVWQAQRHPVCDFQWSNMAIGLVVVCWNRDPKELGRECGSSECVMA